MSKMTHLSLSGVFFQAPNAPKLVFGRGSTADPAGGAYDVPPDLLVGWGGSTPLHTLPAADCMCNSLVVLCILYNESELVNNTM